MKTADKVEAVSDSRRYDPAKSKPVPQKIDEENSYIKRSKHSAYSIYCDYRLVIEALITIN